MMAERRKAQATDDTEWRASIDRRFSVVDDRFDAVVEHLGKVDSYIQQDLDEHRELRDGQQTISMQVTSVKLDTQTIVDATKGIGSLFRILKPVAAFLASIAIIAGAIWAKNHGT